MVCLSGTKFRDTQLHIRLGSTQNINAEKKILEESKRASIYQLWADPRFSKQLCNPLCPLMCADPKLEIRIEWMLDYIT